jgi:hypothetical protein
MGSWWMTVGKLDHEVEALTLQLQPLVSHPRLGRCTTVLRAGAALVHARVAVRRAAGGAAWGWGETDERLLAAAASSVAHAATSLGEALGLARPPRPTPRATTRSA